MKQNNSKLQLILAMVIWGTIGLFRKFIPLSSGMLALSRGFIGCIFLVIFVKAKGIKSDFSKIKKCLVPLCISGFLIGLNWAALFEAYRYTSVSTATLCYYMAPVFIILLSPVFFKEKLSVNKILCVLYAFVGMLLVSGFVSFEGGFHIELQNIALEYKGILYGLFAAAIYAAVVIINKKLPEIPAYEKTIIQLLSAGIIMIPYVLITKDYSIPTLAPVAVIMILLVGVLHTGTAYALYFGSMDKLKAQTIALFSYIDPVVALILSALLLHENLGVTGIIGAVLILGSAFYADYKD